MIVKEASYETSEPTVDSQVVTLQGSGADVLLIVATPKFAAQAIRKSYDLGWNAVRYLSNVSPSIATVLKPAGLEKSKGLITDGYIMDVNDPLWKDETSMQEWKAFTDKYMSAKEYTDAQRGLRLRRGRNHGSDAHAMRKRPVARERHEAGGEHEGVRGADADPRHHRQHLARQFQSDPPMQLLTFDGTSWRLMGPVVRD